MRLAVISTPRSGNTWVRTVLADVYDLAQIAVHTPAELPHEPPADAIVQLHWPREPGFRDWLARHGFGVVVIARHPIDVLVSMLHFARRETETRRWLDGEAGLPAGFRQASPTDRVFADYALGAGARNVLGVSHAWWHEDGAARLRYETLVRDPAAGFAPLLDRLGPARRPLADALHRARLEVWQATWNRHGWQGRPGLWRSLVLPGLATRIHWHHAAVFGRLGYRPVPYLLTRRAAERNWAAALR